LYEAYGGIVLSTGSSENNRLANTKERDFSIGLDNHGFRYFDPEVGRYVSLDPIGFDGGVNWYGYVFNNPINFIDPLGLGPNEPEPLNPAENEERSELTKQYQGGKGDLKGEKLERLRALNGRFQYWQQQPERERLAAEDAARQAWEASEEGQAAWKKEQERDAAYDKEMSKGTPSFVAATEMHNKAFENREMLDPRVLAASEFIVSSSVPFGVIGEIKPIAWVVDKAGKIVGFLVKKGQNALGKSGTVETELVERAMSQAELVATQQKGLTRGGREGATYVSDAVNSSANRARQRLALAQTPEVRVTLEVPKGSFGPPTRVNPKNGMPGRGMERVSPGPVPARVVGVEQMRR
jgi:RHS repeat-associated protein